MQSAKPSAIVKPTLDTRYHVDFTWFERNGEDLRTYLLSHLSPEQRERIMQSAENHQVDYIDPDTGEVTKLDELQLAIRAASVEPDFINPHTSLVDSIFRVFLANGNKPLSCKQIAEYVGRPASLVLKTLTGGRVYKGIRPTSE